MVQRGARDKIRVARARYSSTEAQCQLGEDKGREKRGEIASRRLLMPTLTAVSHSVLGG